MIKRNEVNKTNETEGLLTVQDVARRLKVTPAYVYLRTATGGGPGGQVIPHVKLGEDGPGRRIVRFFWPEVLQWLQTYHRGGPETPSEGDRNSA